MKQPSFCLYLISVLQVGIATLAFGQHHKDSMTQQETHFEAVHSEHRATIRINGTPDKVFSLFEPEGLKRWN